MWKLLGIVAVLCCAALSGRAVAQDPPSAPPSAKGPVIRPQPSEVNPPPAPPVDKPMPQPGEWKILIRPDGYDPANEWEYVFSNPDTWPLETETLPPGAKMSYDQAYRAVPYRFAEYLANPSYRHDAAMEIMFGQLRPTTVVRQPYGPQRAPALQINNNIGWFRPWYWQYATDLY